MQYAIDLTNQRRQTQHQHNLLHGITPTSTTRHLDTKLKLESHDELYNTRQKIEKMPPAERKKMLAELNKAMAQASRELNFEEAIRLRDEIDKIKKL
jgi:excinuclease ABC subunit B